MVPLLYCGIILSELITRFKNSIYVLKQIALLIDYFALLQVLLLDAHPLSTLLNLFRCEVLELWVDLSDVKLLEELLFANEIIEKGQLRVDFIYFYFCLLHFRTIEIDYFLLISEDNIWIVMHQQLLLMQLFLSQLLFLRHGFNRFLMVHLLYQLLLLCLLLLLDVDVTLLSFWVNGRLFF